jgi:hypothetical protein
MSGLKADGHRVAEDLAECWLQTKRSCPDSALLTTGEGCKLGCSSRRSGPFTEINTCTLSCSIPGDEVMQSQQVFGARRADRRADEDSEPVPGLMQYPIRPHFQFRRLVRCRVMWPPSEAQAIGRQQCADGQQRYPQGQVEPGARVALGLDQRFDALARGRWGWGCGPRVTGIIDRIRVATLTREPMATPAASLVPRASTQHPWQPRRTSFP